METNYNKFPAIKAEGKLATGWKEVKEKLQSPLTVLDIYPGMDQETVKKELESSFDEVINTRDIYKVQEEIDAILEPHVTGDRIFGTMFYGVLMDLVDEKKLEDTKEKLKEYRESNKSILVIGPGARLITQSGLFVYGDMARWEIQLRYRKGMPNFFWDNPAEDPLRKIKRGFFVEWRIFDKHKHENWEDMQYLLDFNGNEPKLAEGKAVRQALEKAVTGPIRTVPYFDPGVWGGQWMKDVCGLDKDSPNYAWSFDGVPEENSLLLDFSGTVMEIPAMDLVLQEPKKLLGPKVYSRFGAEFPIRFDFLDTIKGQNLSLQVHPLTEYIHRTFGMAYTQDESYYILDADEGATVYLGLKEGVDPEEMFDDLKKANKGEQSFDAEKYVNRFPAKKHDHFLIPAGTIHCSGAGAMVLEISATPYCFTFKLWDWGRVGLDGLPRPVHLDHGKKNVQFDRTTDWVKENLVNAVQVIKEEDHLKEEHTGLHELEFIETRRYWTDTEVELDLENNMSMCNLIEGKRAVIESPDNAFEPYEIHYAETFILPADLKRAVIKSPDGEKIGIIRAYVR